MADARLAYSFGEFVLDVGARLLLRAGGAVHLTPKAMHLLLLLAARQPDAVSKAEIHERLWPGIFVSDANLAPLISEIRKALDDSPQQPQFIRTVHGVGYAFMAAGAIDRRSGRLPPRLVHLDRTFELPPGTHLIGRSPDCLVRLESSTVSRLHARIVIDESGAVLEDLGSRNGSVVGDRPIDGPVRLADGDQIRFGAERMTFRAGAAPDPTETDSP